MPLVPAVEEFGGVGGVEAEVSAPETLEVLPAQGLMWVEVGVCRLNDLEEILMQLQPSQRP
jgi:hypothetical protein